MKGGGLHSCLENDRYIGNAAITGRLFNLGAYPGWNQNVMMPDEWVLGEVYRVSEETLHRLDYVEGVERGHYQRRAVIAQMTSTGDQGVTVREVCPVWAYHYQSEAWQGDRIEQKEDQCRFPKPFASWNVRSRGYLLDKVGH